MNKTRSKSRYSGKSSFTPKKKGLFEDGLWLCDCKPRKPAISLKVKKDGPNKGKTFYTCDERKCDFFLFEHDAAPREREALLMHNCRSENGIVARVQAKGEPPPTPSFGGPRNKPAPGPPQQRIFSGLPPAARPAEDDSEYLSGSEDDDEDTQGGAVGAGAGARPIVSLDVRDGSGSTARNSSGSKSSRTLSAGAAPSQARVPGLSAQVADPQTPVAKRKRGVFYESSDEEFGGGELDDSEVERQLARAVEESARKQQQQQRSFSTPSAQRTAGRDGGGGGGLPTPVTRNSLLLATEAREERSAKRLRFAEAIPEDGEDELQGQQGRRSRDASTPTPYRKTNALLPAASEPVTPTATRTAPSPFKTPLGGFDVPQIADEVMTLLHMQPLSEATRRNVRSAMERHETRVRGIVKGRDAARAALEARDARIAELQAKVVNLENARRMDRASLKELSRGLDRLSQED